MRDLPGKANGSPKQLEIAAAQARSDQAHRACGVLMLPQARILMGRHPLYGRLLYLHRAHPMGAVSEQLDGGQTLSKEEPESGKREDEASA